MKVMRDEEIKELSAPIHPGEILKNIWLDRHKITMYGLAKAIHVPQTRISQIVKGERSITANTALRLAKFFGGEAMYWMRLQNEYDLRIEDNKEEV